MRYRTKPVEVDAVQFDDDNYTELAHFTNGQFRMAHPDDRVDDPDIVAEVFDVLHSTWVGVKRNQWIIRGTKGEFYPCDPETFAWKYEEA